MTTPRGIIIRRKHKINNIHEHHNKFANAVTLLAGENRVTIPWMIEGNTVQTDEPTPSAVTDAIHQTVWYKLVAGKGTITFSTGELATSFDANPYSRTLGRRGSADLGAGYVAQMAIGVYTGPSLDSLTEVKSAVSTPGNPATLILHNPSLSQTYWIQVGTLEAETTGQGVLYFDCQKPPANDPPPVNGTGELAGTPVDLTGSSGNTSFDSCVYFDNPDEPASACGPVHKSAWFSWTAPTTGDYTFTATNGTHATVLAVWNSDVTVEIGCTTGTPASYTLSATEGVTYIIEFGHVSPDECGTVTLAWSAGSAITDYYVKFDVKVDATGASWASNGNVAFPPSFWGISDTADGSFPIQGIGLVRHKIAGVDQDTYTWEVLFTDTFPDGFRFGPEVVGGTTYTVEMQVHPGGPGVGFVDGWIDGVEYGPWFADDSWKAAPYDYIHFGADQGVSASYTAVWDFDNFTFGTSARGSSEIISADFASAIVPPFDSLSDAGAETTIVAGEMHQVFDASGNANSYAVKGF